MSAEATLGLNPFDLQPSTQLGIISFVSPVQSQLPKFRKIGNRMLPSDHPEAVSAKHALPPKLDSMVTYFRQG